MDEQTQQSIAWFLLIMVPSLEKAAKGKGVVMVDKSAATHLLYVADYVASDQQRREKAARAAGRKPIGERAMTSAERTRKSRERRKVG